MNIGLLRSALQQVKFDLEEAIVTGEFNGKRYENGQRAKEALIRSQRLIMRVHEAVKRSVSARLEKMKIRHSIYPPLGSRSPELRVCGFLKAKQQDIVMLMHGDRPEPEIVSEGALSGSTDPVGRQQSERSIIIGVRSQLSSVAKNFDTLMERAFAETLNLRLRLPKLTMGEVYLLPVVEYDDDEMKRNSVGWKARRVPLERFISTFVAISGRGPDDLGQGSLFKYERTALVLVDFRQSPPRVFLTLQDLVRADMLPSSFQCDFSVLSPGGFAEAIVDTYLRRHPPPSD